MHRNSTKNAADTLWRVEPDNVPGTVCNVVTLDNEHVASGLSEEVAQRIALDHNRRLVATGESDKPDDDVLQALLDSLRDLHETFYNHLKTIGEKVKSKAYVRAQLVDLGFLCREAEALLDDWRKDCKAHKEQIASTMSQEVITEGLNDIGNEGAMTVHGKRAFAVCDMELVPALPRRNVDDPDYVAFCEHFGMPRQLIGTRIVKLDFEEAKKAVMEVAAGQRKAIPGLGKSFPHYTATFTRKKR